MVVDLGLGGLVWCITAICDRILSPVEDFDVWMTFEVGGGLTLVREYIYFYWEIIFSLDMTFYHADKD